MLRRFTGIALVISHDRALLDDLTSATIRIHDRLLASAAPSPGEGRKLALALGLGTHAWGLVLDEPTNHLDLPSIERLVDALAAYPGAIVIVPHDDQVAAHCTTSTWNIADGQVTVDGYGLRLERSDARALLRDAHDDIGARLCMNDRTVATPSSGVLDAPTVP
ncbi:MAG: transporter, ATPase subunit [Myxococcales bacterium]|nr:transporter, ATPase subunit [Myxococcales bacterium]